MLSLPGYRITEEVHAGIKTLVYRGIRLQDQCPVILKTLRADYPSQNDLARLQHEYALTKDWDQNDQLRDQLGDQLRGLPRTYELQRHMSTQILIQEDIGGVSLSRLLADQALPLATFLPLALALAQSLNQIHQRHLIHKDINPSNLVVNLKTGQVQIIDFGISTQLSRETPQLQSPGHLEGTLAYLSPEQTGRMNRALDYRTDFYSLGVTFYEMLAGVPPFNSTDPLALVHCHLAQTPLPLHERCPEVPPVLSELIQKMMAKTAEDRYQSAFGLIADLTSCQERLLANEGSAAQRGAAQRGAVHTIAPFTLGQQDVSEFFQIPQKLYGRETETQQVLDAFTRVSQGRAEILLVAGYSGLGKSALVHEVHKPITESKGYFINGKFDQFQRDIPYASLIQAFKELVRQLLGESSAQIARWKASLEQALGSIAQVIIDVIPEVELIMGPQAAVPLLPSTLAQNRFNFALEQFIHAFTTEAHPLVLFLDDLQWVDLPSLQLIKLFMTNPETRYLLIIGAYRDNEVQAAHPLMLTLEEIQKAQTKLETIKLKPLNLEHIQQLLVETFRCNGVESQPLAQLCIRKTEGNPFFLSQFLRALVEAQQISFQHQTGRWEWDMAQLEQTQITSNVVDLMTAKIQTLPQATQAVIRLAACIGNQFDLTTLAYASEQSVPAITQSLWPALQESLIIPLDDTYKHMGFENQTSAPASAKSDASNVRAKGPSFKFIHDRVQQAAYALIQDDAKAMFHLRIGRLLLAHLTPEQHQERIFDLVYHWNQGRDLLTEQKEKEALAQLNRRAGKKAKSSAAYKPALHYFETGLTLITSEGWKTHYELTLSLTVEATEAAWLCGDFERMAALAEMTLQKANTLLDKVPTYEIQILACSARNQLQESIQIATTVLKQFGIKFPARPTKLHVAWGLIKTKLALIGKPVEDLIHLPQMTNPSVSAAMQICSSMESACYFSQPELLPLLICKQIELLIKYGNSPYAAPAYAAYGGILCGGLGEIETGYRFGNLALKISSPEVEPAVRARLFSSAFLTHWKTSLRERHKPLLETYQSALQIGQLELACGACFLYCESLYFSGETLNVVQKALEKYTPVIIQTKQHHALTLQRILEQTILNLQGHSENPCHLTGTSYDETVPINTGNLTAIFLFHFEKMMLCALFQQYPAALEQALVTEKYLDAAISSPSTPLYHFYLALIHLALFSDTPKKGQSQILRKVTAIEKKLKKWAHHAPMTYTHKAHLVGAELARVSGEDLLAMQHYDQAITLAENNAFQQEAALANELAARFHFSKGRGKLAQIYLHRAYAGYQQWGAVAKVRQMEAQYPDLLTSTAQVIGGVNTSAPPFIHRTTIQSSDTMNSETLDLATVMKGAQAISGEIVLGNLLEKLMCIAIENAGAQRGVLLLKTNGELRIEAEGNLSTGNVSANVSSSQATVSVLQSKPLTPPPEADGKENIPPSLPVSLIQYVARSRNTLVLHDACAEGQFMNDPYISQNAAKSVLCVPILHQGKLAGMLYLENNLTEGVFTEDRLEVLKILSAQAAISIENARVYENLESTVAQRTAALTASNVALELAYSAAETARTHAESAKQQATEALDHLREAQTQLVQSAKMASLGHLVAGVAHELNTPIGNALTTSSTLIDSTNILQTALDQGEIRKSTLTNFVGDAVQMADLINRSCQRAAILITSFKQVAADQTSEQRRTFDLHSLVADNIAALGGSFNEALWVIKTEIPNDIECDSYPGPLGQVIANLVQNAVLHAFEGRDSGVLKIVATVKPGAEEDAKVVEMLFSDNGNGMEPEILRHIFEPFYTARSGPDPDRKQGGPGLGLSISLNIVTGVLGGTLSATSEPGYGSQFCLTFPLKAPQRGRNSADIGFIPAPPA
jgi:predicted ATPase/signal transduction histidine kinase